MVSTMAKLGCGDCCADNTKILETILKGKHYNSHEEQTALECHWKKTSSVTSDKIASQPQDLDKSCVYQAQVCHSEWAPMGKKDSGCRENTNQGSAGQNSNQRGYIGLFSGEMAPLNLTVHRILNSATHSSMQNCHQQVSNVNALPKDCIQQRAHTDISIHPSVSHQSGLGNKGSKMPDDLNASKMQECVPLKKRKKYLVQVTEDNPGYEFSAKNNVSTVDQTGSPDKLCVKRTLDNGIRPFTKQFEKSHPVTWSKPVQPYQQVYMHKKNVAIVFPLPLEVVECFKSLTNPTKDSKVSEEGVKARPVGPHPEPALLHPTTKESDLISSSTSSSVAQTNHGSPEMITQCLPETGFSQCSRPEAPIQAKDTSHQKDSLYSVPLSSTSVCMREESSNMDNQCSAGHIHEDVTTTNERNINGSESQSVTEDNEQWSLQRLQRLMFDLEKKQSMSRKEVHFADLSSEILRLFWNEDFQELCETAKSDYYVNIMKEVKLYSGKRNSVILQECRTLQDLDHVAEDLHNTRQNPVVPTVESESFQSSVLNPSDCNKSTAKVNNDEIRMERDENVKVPENYVAATSTQAQSQPLLTVHENNCSVEEDLARVLTDKSTDMDVEHKDDYSNRGPVETKKPVFDCLSKPTLTECPDNSKNVTVNSEKGEELPENKTARNEVSLVRSLNEQSLAMSDNCMHVNSEEDQPTTEMTCSLEDCNNADSTDCCSFLEINVLSPETAKKLYFTEPKKDVKTIHKDVSVETCTEKTDQVIVYHCDFIPEDDTQINTNVKLAKNNIGNDGAQQVKQYCCLAKWFQDLGYAFNVPCACKKNTAKRVTEESSNIPSDANTDNLEIEEVITDYEDVRKIASAISVHQMNEPLRTGGTREFKKGKPAHDSCKNKTTNHTSCSKLVAKSDLIPYLGQDLSQGDSSFPLTPTGSDLQVEEKDKKITTPEVQKEKRTVNLALFGLSSLNHNKTVGVTRNNPEKKTGFGIRSFDTEHFPPATLNVRVNNAVRLNNDAIGRQTAKQRILKSWQNSLAPTQMFPDKQWSRKLKNGSKSRTETADIFEIEKSITPTAFDAMKNLLSTQQHIQTHESEIPSPTEQQKTSDGQSKNKKYSTKRNKKKNRILDSISLTRRKKGLYAHKSKSSASSVELPCPLGQSKHESSKRSMLDYRILPETFSFRDGGSLMKAHQSKDAAYGQKTETEMPKKRTVENLVIGVWCVSPKKKGKLKSTLPSSSSVSASTFQEFKKRYEEKKIVHPKTI
ncbi:hypothetical protein AMEX_G3696 [Astyanax mexicanus]|uniref:Uncharacterized protein n=1 Tax=Astyanax mexicanus TaxID=7994 RepID=A0A8T2MHF1_ASTMX|nr:hypothetical protein AMEX_G3696 [Astyanax mexicanus]